MSEMKEWAVTFGQRYRREEHPALGDMPELPDGYWVIYAPDYDAARSEVFNQFGSRWSDFMLMSDFMQDAYRFYPMGRLNPPDKDLAS